MTISHRMFLGMMIFGLIAATSGCNEEDGIILPALTNNEISSQWVGTYQGKGLFSQQNMADRTVNGAVKISDMGDNYIQVRLSLPGVTYSPSMRHEAIAYSVSRASKTNLIDGTTFYINLIRSNTLLSGELRVIGADEAMAWVFSFANLVLQE